MANLLGQNIGTNYKGILNLNTLNGNLTATLQAVTDGDGNASPLQLSTTQAGVTGPVQTGTGSLYKPFLVNYSNSTIGVTGLEAFSVGVTATNASRYSVALRLGASSDTQSHYIYGGDNSSQGFVISRAQSCVSAFGNGLLVAGSWLDIAPSARLHVRGDGTNPIARFESSGGTMLFGVASDLNLQLGNGNLTFGGTNDSTNYNSAGNAYLFRTNVSSTAGLSAFVIRNISGGITATSGNSGGILLDMATFGAAAGSANFRPLSIAYTINNSGAQTGTATGIFLNATETALNGMTHNLIDLQVGGVSRFRVANDGAVTAGGTSASASAILQADSTTKGFLPPRMTTAQKTAITSPAKGLVVYDTDTDKLCVYNGAWTDLH